MAEPRSHPPPEVAVDVWYWRTDTVPASLDAWATTIEKHGLSREEQARAARFVAPDRQLAFFAARAGLRAILAGYTSRPPGELAFETGTHGKPFLAGGPQFNLSHSGRWAALAVSADHPVGIDIESPRPVSRNLPGRFFSTVEANLLAGLEGAAWDDTFFRCWTRKEAVLKALGTGLSRDPRTFTVSVGVEPPFTVRGVEATAVADGAWHLVGLQPPAPGYLAALALTAPAAPQVTYRSWTPDFAKHVAR